MNLTDAWQQLLVALLGLVTTVVIPAAAMLARSWVKAKVAKIQNDETRAGIEDALERLDLLIQTQVAELNQTVKQVGADGKIDTAEALRLKKAAFKLVSAQLNPWMKETLQKALPDLQRYIASRIEAKVAEAKP